MRRTSVVLTCEHGGNRIPARWRALFRGAEGVLESHRGWDPGALDLARALSRRLAAPLYHSTVSRLLVELNRSPGHRRLFSEFTRDLPREERDRIARDVYRPYRDEVEAAVRSAPGRVVHLSVHTFTPVLDGEVRRADVGLLYDPARRPEREFCAAWQAILRERLPGRTILRNSPYRGASDGFTTWLRRRLPPSRYLGLEIEVNQEHALGAPAGWRAIQEGIVRSLAEALQRRRE